MKKSVKHFLKILDRHSKKWLQENVERAKIQKELTESADDNIVWHDANTWSTTASSPYLTVSTTASSPYLTVDPYSSLSIGIIDFGSGQPGVTYVSPR